MLFIILPSSNKLSITARRCPYSNILPLCRCSIRILTFLKAYQLATCTGSASLSSPFLHLMFRIQKRNQLDAGSPPSVARIKRHLLFLSDDGSRDTKLLDYKQH
ncbi:hypothetical protein ES332_D10G135400v1 [Gossypium tomentosum]|uniref:Uncharacterized protein n=1 Tax=Gossypium tomentosum TaxID=34277 RepID=A0A5D2J4H1_GOSTO|nr:hypothetical protein ES332_D10G135400v1 [Gossypium tomentosum]